MSLATWDKITGALGSTTTAFGGDWGNLVSDFFNGVNVGLADPTKLPRINTLTRFKFEKLGLFDGDESHEVQFSVDDIDTGPTRKVKIRRMNNPFETDYMVLEGLPQTLLNKTIDSDLNTITNIVNADVKAAAGIVYSKLSLANSIVDSDISAHTSSKITLTTKGQLNSAIVYNDQANTFGDFDQKFRSTRFKVSNPANTFFYNWTGSAIAADRTITLPLLTANDELLFKDFTATITNKSISGSTNTLTNIGDSAISSHTSTKITITAKGQLNSAIVYNDQTNSFGDFNQVFKDNRLLINNPADTFAYTIIGAAIAANRNLTLPLLTGDDTAVTQAFTQTLTNKTIDADSNTITNIENADIKAAAGIVTTKLADSANFILKTLDNAFGAHFQDFTKMTAPASPGANDIRLFVDTADTHLKIKNNAGTVVDLHTGGGGATNLDALTDVDLTTTAPINGDVLTYTSTGTKWVPAAPPGAGGGITASSTDTLTNKSINADNNTITNIDNNEIKAAAGIVTSKLADSANFILGNQTNTFGDFNQIFRDNRLLINNPADTFNYTIIGAAIAANRTITLPLLTGNDTAVTEAFTQTLTNKTINTTSNTIPFLSEYTYTIYQDGGAVKARNNKTGVVTSNATLGPLVTTILASGDASFEVQSGTYILSSFSGWTVVSNTQIRFQDEAKIYVPDDYNSYLFKFGNNVQYCRIEGGEFDEAGATWSSDWVAFLFEPASPNGIAFNTIRDVHVLRAKAAIHIKTIDNSWVNGNYFDSVLADRCEYLVLVEHGGTHPGTDGIAMNDNTFIDCNAQTYATLPQALGGIVGVNGYRNQFIGCAVWDIVASNASAPSMTITSNGKHTIVLGGILTNSNFTDSGQDTMIMDHWHGLYNKNTTDLYDTVNMHGATLSNAVIDSTVTGIINANVASGAAIAYSKLNLATSILNADISASAGIVTTKLADSANFALKNVANTFAETITLTKTAVAGAETMFSMGVSDASGDSFTLENSEGTAGYFAPIFRSNQLAATATNSEFVPGMYFQTVIKPAKDLDQESAIVFGAKTDTNAAISNRCILQINNLFTGIYKFYPSYVDFTNKELRNATITASSNTLSGVAQNPLNRRWGTVQSGYGTAVGTVGVFDGLCQQFTAIGGGSNTTSFDTTEGKVINYQTANSSGVNGGLISATSGGGLGRRLFAGKMVCRVKLDSTTSARFYFGLTSATALPISDTVLATSDSGIIVGFTSADTNYQIRTHAGSGAVTTTQMTGPVAKTSSTSFHTIEISWTASGNYTVTFDGTAQTISTDLPATTTDLYPNLVVQTSAAVQRTFTVKALYIETDK